MRELCRLAGIRNLQWVGGDYSSPLLQEKPYWY